ncbi:GNAT family N-acetyltransferase [Microvirga sp. c23x22]|uniref:GNAT family N-acetyltransferase n=2 Tax=Microvirga terricola TaxID=2719797 RepID=A0ABX0VET9_9HYPH|nr:GNAT family N-acetyltransferase [Microvirga terricola]
MQVPVLETERLVLRGHRAGDFEACAALWADPEVTRFISGKPSMSEESWGRLVRYVGHWALLGFGYWAVEEKASGGFVGEIGFADYKRDIEPSLAGVPELGWVISPRVHGRGYATEAVRAAIAWGDKHFGAIRTACIISPENTASLRVAEKCGFRQLLATTYKDKPTVMFTRGA